MKHSNLREAIEAYYVDRLNGDPDVIDQWFHPSAVVSMNGSGMADLGKEPNLVSGRRRANDSVDQRQAHLEVIRATWKLHDVEIVDTLTDGDLIVVRAIVDIECLPTKKRVTTEICEHYRFAGDRITSVIAFFDTALAERMLAA